VENNRDYPKTLNVVDARHLKSHATNAIMGNITIPTESCWEIAGHYNGESVAGLS
jgi:hypothetical protein